MVDRLNERLNAYCEENRISGVIRVTKNDRITLQYAVGFADAANKTPFTDGSMFTFYSLSKPFCAMGLLKLKDRGLVDLDRHPKVYLPEAEGFDERVTLRHLLRHTSGLPDFEQVREFGERYAPGYASKAREHLRLLTAYPSYFAPDTDAKYANVNFVIPALVIENVAGLPYADYMKKEVFEPLGMKTAVVDNETLTIPNRVKGYEFADGILRETEKSHDWMLGAGDIVGTVDDVYCLNRAIKHRLLLSQKTWQEVLTPSPLNGMGMGCTLSSWHGKDRITHNGGHTGFRTLHIQLPEDDFDIILLSNSGFGNARVDLSEIIYTAFYGDSDEMSETVEMDKGYIR